MSRMRGTAGTASNGSAPASADFDGAFPLAVGYASARKEPANHGAHHSFLTGVSRASTTSMLLPALAVSQPRPGSTSIQSPRVDDLQVFVYLQAHVFKTSAIANICAHPASLCRQSEQQDGSARVPDRGWPLATARSAPVWIHSSMPHTLLLLGCCSRSVRRTCSPTLLRSCSMRPASSQWHSVAPSVSVCAAPAHVDARASKRSFLPRPLFPLNAPNIDATITVITTSQTG